MTYKKHTTEDILNKIKEIHADKYDYSKVVFNGWQTKIKLICPTHGEFELTPVNVIYNKRGCPHCSKEKLAKARKAKLISSSEIIDKAKAVHGDKYDYSALCYTGMLNKVEIICPEHGSFFITPAKHIHAGQGCPKCKGLYKTTKDFIKEAQSIHGNKYNYDKVVYKNASTKVIITCPIHGDFEMTPAAHLSNKAGCPSCKHGMLSYDQFVEKAKAIHNDYYDYSLVKFKHVTDYINVICPVHGAFKQTVKNHLKSTIACPECRQHNFIDTDKFIKRAKQVHGESYDYSKTCYTAMHAPIIVTCPEHGDFTVLPNNHLKGHKCPKCANSSISDSELKLNEFIKSLGLTTLTNDRSIISPSELDIVIPSKKIAIEFNGLYWHSSDLKAKSYHLDKTKACQKKGIKLIHIFEDEWINKNRIVKSRLKHILGVDQNKIFARKCAVQPIDNKLSSKFCNKYHLQGACSASINLGLFYKNRLVAVMTFGKPRFNKQFKWELIRYCTISNFTIVGGASKLFKTFRRTNPGSVVTYADRRWSDGGLYRALGMTQLSSSKPSYYYFKGLNRLNRVAFQKHKLKHLLPNYDPYISEYDNMRNNGYKKIYDCGCLKFGMQN